MGGIVQPRGGRGDGGCGCEFWPEDSVNTGKRIKNRVLGVPIIAQEGNQKPGRIGMEC